ASVTPDQVFSSQGVFTATGTAVDNAGNSAGASFGPIQIDKTAPSVLDTINSPAATGWYNHTTGTAVYSYTASDTGGSGLASPAPDSSTFGEGTARPHSSTINDVAGNSTPVSVSGINVDLTKPVTSAALSGTLGDNNWYTSDVRVSLPATDNLSGVAATYY